MAKAKAKLPTEVMKALHHEKPTADTAGLLSDLIDVWGGTRRLAMDLQAEFEHASQGSMARQRILEMIQRLIVVNTSNEASRPRNPDDLSDEELADVARGLLARLAPPKPAEEQPP